MSLFRPDNYAKKPQKPIRSTWVVAVIAVLILALFVAAGDGGIGMWLFLMGLLGLLTAAYALVFRRRSWARLETRKTAKGAMAAAGVLTVLGLVVFSFTAPPAEPKAESAAVATATPTPSQTPSASPSASRKATAVAGASCPVAGKVETVTNSTASPSPTATSTATKSPMATSTGSKSPSASPTPTSSTTASAAGAVFTCTEDDNKKLVWMDSDKSKKLLADRKATEEKAEADRVAAEAETKRVADEAAAAEAQRVADEQAAADAAVAAAEAQRLADEQARQQYVAPAPAPVAPAPAPAPVAPAPVGPAVVHPGAFCSGGVGVSKTGKPMVCGVASDGRMRWMSA